jgi:hypothetical protein
MITSRFEIEKIINPNSIGCELGVFKGDFSDILIKSNKFIKLYLVDLFDGNVQSGDTRGNNVEIINGQELHGIVLRKFKDNSKVFIVKQDSISFLLGFPNEYFDFIYIDTTHQYEQTKNELNIAFEKVKKNGIIAGHDYNQIHFHEVCDAVNEFSKDKDLKLNLTSEDNLETFYFYKTHE